ncbi:MAG: polysaccharide biosynthesis tyrosine autokinase [Negativicutes bacterium]
MGAQKHQLIVHEQPKSPIAEAYRTLRTNIQYAKVDGELKVLLFTSAGPGEGKSTVTANTAVALAQAGHRVILIDCDLRKPVQHHIFRLNKKGLTNCLVGESPANELLQDTEVANLRVLTSGPVPPNPAELLGSARMGLAIDAFKAVADFVLLDSPPTIAVTDACVLSRRADGVILVLDADTVRPDMAQKAKELLENAQANILGAILNRAEVELEHSYYYYYYGHGDDKEKKE